MSNASELVDKPDESLFDLVENFVIELRVAGLPISLSENIDAVNAVRSIQIEDRELFKCALAATLVKSDSHRFTFDTLFDVFFAYRGGHYSIDGRSDDRLVPAHNGELETQQQPPGQGGQGGGGAGLSPEELAQMLFMALLDNDEVALAALARQAVKRYAGMEPGRPVGGTYYLYKTIRSLDFDGLLERLSQHGDSERQNTLSTLEQTMERDEFQSRLDRLRKEIEAEIRRRLVADRGAEAMAKSLRRPLPEDVEFMHASREDMVKLRQAIYPLTRKLAVRLARKRRHKRRGSLDFRSTMRRSLSYGGVPVEPRFRQRKPHKPEIFIIADISGSVAAFARFTLQLVYAISGQFSKVRSFVFIDGLDEVTEFFDKADDVGEAIYRVNTEANVVWVDGHSDYGHAFGVFWEAYGKDVGPKTTVMILGDARNNYHDDQAWIIDKIQQRSRKLYWLNPEPKAYWNTGDSVLGSYSRYCDGVFEVRNLRQLERFVDLLV